VKGDRVVVIEFFGFGGCVDIFQLAFHSKWELRGSPLFLYTPCFGYRSCVTPLVVYSIARL
jgi:hypothetical protein